jgi:hypothetical protein
VPRRYEELKMKFSIDTLLQLESYVKLVEAINRAKEMKPSRTTERSDLRTGVLDVLNIS